MSTPNTPAAPAADQAPAIRQPINFGETGVRLTSLEDAFRFAKYVAVSGWAPKGMDKPEAILIALQHAAEIGLPPLSGLQNIAVINGRPGIYGDAALALVRASGLVESYKEEEVGERGKDSWGFRVTTKRKDQPDGHSDSFTVADAKTAGLWGKQGPWSQYPKRMLKFRARGFVLRDAFGDVLKGLRTVEELSDLPADVRNVTPTRPSLASIAAGEPEAIDTATVAADFTDEDRDGFAKALETYMLDAGVTESALMKELTQAQIGLVADLALFEQPTAVLHACARYVAAKAAQGTVKGEAS
jgi:hypothetical protein